MRAAHDTQVIPWTGRSSRSSSGLTSARLMVDLPSSPGYCTPLPYLPPGRRAMRGYSMHKDDYRRRLARIEGQVRGLQRMVDEDEYCVDVQDRKSTRLNSS